MISSRCVFADFEFNFELRSPAIGRALMKCRFLFFAYFGRPLSARFLELICAAWRAGNLNSANPEDGGDSQAQVSWALQGEHLTAPQPELINIANRSCDQPYPASIDLGEWASHSRQLLSPPTPTRCQKARSQICCRGHNHKFHALHKDNG